MTKILILLALLQTGCTSGIAQTIKDIQSSGCVLHSLEVQGDNFKVQCQECTK